MKPPGQLRRTPFKRPSKPTLTRTEMRRLRSDKTDFSKKVKAAIAARSRGVCEAQTVVCSQAALPMHHRKGRGKGLSTEALGLHLCDRCHVAIHARPDWSIRHGLMIPRNQAAVDVTIFLGCSFACVENHTGLGRAHS